VVSREAGKKKIASVKRRRSKRKSIGPRDGLGLSSTFLLYDCPRARNNQQVGKRKKKEDSREHFGPGQIIGIYKKEADEGFPYRKEKAESLSK